MGLKKRAYPLFPLLLSVAAGLSSCSTTRLLKDNELRLDKNEVTITNDKSFPATSLNNYIKQQPNTSYLGFKPLLYVYNWSDGSGKGINRFWEAVGQPPVIYDQAMVEMSKRNIGNRLTKLGYFDSKVESELRLKGKNARVTYYVTVGKRYRIDDIVYVLPKGRKDFAADFYADTLNSRLRKGIYLSEQDLSEEVDRSVASLREQGYFALSRNNYSFVADTTGRKGAVLEYIITEEDAALNKVKINEVNINYPEDLHIRESVLEGVNLINPGDTYRESTVSNTYSRFSALKIFRTVGIDMRQVDDGNVDCNINLTKSQRQGFKTNLELSTNSSGLMGVSPQINFYHKNIFGGGEWLNVGFVGNFQFKPSDNISSNELGTSLSLSLPQFLGLGYKFFQGPTVPRTELNAAFNYQNRPEYKRNIFSTSFGYSGTIRERFYYQVYPLQINYVRLFNMNAKFSALLDKNPFLKYSYQDHCDVGIGANLFFNSSKDLIPKTDYYSVKLSADISGNVLSLFKGLMKSNEAGDKLVFNAPFSQYARAELSYARGFRFGREDRQSIAYRLLAGIGYAYGNSNTLPYEKQFYCGGASSMRGWQARALGPGSEKMNESFSIPSQTGDIKFEAGIEYRFPLVMMLEGALFAEMGNVWNNGSAIRMNDIAADWGLGLRVNLGFLLIRADWGIRLRDPSLETRKWMDPVTALKNKGSALHIGVGYPF